MKQGVVIAVLTGLLGFIAPAAAHAIVPHPQKQVGTSTHSTVRQAPKPPKHDQVHRGGVDGTIALIQFISTRRQSDEQQRNQAGLQGGAAQVLASSKDAEPRTQTTLTARAVDSLPPHWGSTHLCI